MPQTRDCDYCGDDIEPGTGTMFVRTDGTVIHYCSSKCENNADLGREARDLEWTESGGQRGRREEQVEEEASADSAATADEEPAAEAVDEDAQSEESADADEAEADAESDEAEEPADEEADEE